MSLSLIQLRKLDGDDIPFTQIGVGDSEQVFYSPLPDWKPTDEEVARVLEERRRDRHRDWSREIMTKD